MTDQEAHEAVKSGSGFQVSMGVFFDQRPEVFEAQCALVKPILRKLGALRGNEAELRSLTWRHAGVWVLAGSRRRSPTPPKRC